jgi:hypothetical protein
MTIKLNVVDAGYGREIDWQDSAKPDALEERTFLSETAWVVLSSGFSEHVVRRLFPGITQAFLDWESATAIARRGEECAASATAIFSNPSKMRAIVDVARQVDELGWLKFRAECVRDPVTFLRRLPYIGPVTANHLAKNLGFDVVKSDRHLVRSARAAGFSTASELCEQIASQLGERLAVVDLVIWRYATLNKSYVSTWGSLATRPRSPSNGSNRCQA